MSGTLYVVATPIGNMEDISARAISTLASVALVCAEDTRVSRKIMTRFSIDAKLVSYHQHSELKRTEEIINLLRAGQSVALVSDAGTPGISDPGGKLVELAREQGIDVRAVAGPSSVTAALSISGFPSDTFTFFGFMPRKKSEAEKIAAEIDASLRTCVLFESPSRLLKTLSLFTEKLPDREMVVCRELTKLHEESVRATPRELLAHYEDRGVKGEIVIVVSPRKEDGPFKEYSSDDIASVLMRLVEEGHTDKDAVRVAAKELSLPKRDVYAEMERIKDRRRRQS